MTRVERGVRIPTLKTLGKLAFGLGVNPAVLVDIDEAPHRQDRVELEDEDERVQQGASAVVVAYLPGVQRCMEK